MIVWREEAALLRRCLLALKGQGADQIVVSRSNAAEFSEALAAEFPEVAWVAQGVASGLPALQWSALPEVRSEVVAFLEAPSIPGTGWVSAHRQAHAAHPEILACGGPVRLPQGPGVGERGWYWSDYAAYTPGRLSGPTRDLTDANVSYKVHELREHPSLLAEAAWGWRIRKASARMSYYETSAWLDYPCPYTLAAALGDRWLAGRAHGSVRGLSVPGRMMFSLGAPLLPVVLAWRGWQEARRAGYGLRYTLVLPWTLAFHSSWTFGELAGLLTGSRSR